ncbi:MAG: hypothetical protein ABIW30_05325 [Arenimonas sp.]
MISPFQLLAYELGARDEIVFSPISLRRSSRRLATTRPVTPRSAKSGGTENGSITRPRSWLADQIIDPRASASTMPTSPVRTFSARETVSLAVCRSSSRAYFSSTCRAGLSGVK